MDRVARATHTHARRIGTPTILITVLAVLAVGLAVRLLPANAQTASPLISSGDPALIVETPDLTGFENIADGEIEIASASVVNTTDAPIHVTGASITVVPGSTGNGPDFTLIDPGTCVGADIPAFGYCVLTIEMTGHTETQSEFEDDVNVTASTFDRPFVGELARPGQPFYVLSTSPENPPNPFRMAFGSTQVGSTSATQTVTITDADSDEDAAFDGEIGHITAVTVTGPDAADYTATGCSGQNLTWTTLPDPPSGTLPTPQTCQITASDRPAAVGDRPAILDVAYCPTINNNEIDAVLARRVPIRGGGAAPQASITSPDLCPQPEGDTTPTYPLHLLILLDGTGTPVPPPSSPPPPPVFNPALTTSPAVVQGGRNTQVSGTGFPANSPVVVALRTIGSPTVTSPTVLAALPQAFHVTTNAAGAFTAQTLVVMPNVTPGNYPLEAVCTSPSGAVVTVTINLLVVPGTAQPPQFVNRN